MQHQAPWSINVCACEHTKHHLGGDHCTTSNVEAPADIRSDGLAHALTFANSTKAPRSSGLTQPRPYPVNPEGGALSPERAKSG